VRGSSWLGSARYGLAGMAVCGPVSLGPACIGMAWQAWLGLAVPGVFRPGRVRRGTAWQAGRRTVGHDGVRPGGFRLSLAGESWRAKEVQVRAVCVTVRPGRQGSACCVSVWRVQVRCGKVFFKRTLGLHVMSFYNRP
jgi:hypothetical protein